MRSDPAQRIIMIGRVCQLSRSVLAVEKSCQSIQKRTFWRMLNAVFNRPDKNRIKEIGPERACAEWLLRCGAHPKFVGSDRFHTDYNSLVATSMQVQIEEVNANEAAVMDIGFEHFDGCKHIKKIRFHHCPYLEDAAILQLPLLKDSLQHLEISSCGDVSEEGLEACKQLHLLETMLLYDLPNVTNKKKIFDELQEALPTCAIDFKDINSSDSKT